MSLDARKYWHLKVDASEICSKPGEFGRVSPYYLQGFDR